MIDSNRMDSRKLKIALVSDGDLPKAGEAETHLRDLANRLSGEGHQVHVITPFPGDENGERFKIHRLRVPLLPRLKIVFTPGAFREIEAIFKQESFDIVHCHANNVSPAAYGGVYLSRKLGIPSVITWDDSNLGSHHWGLALFDHIFGWSKWPVLFSGASEGVAREVKPLVKHKKVSVLHKALDELEWKVAPVKRDSRDVWIVSVMRMADIKCGKDLINLIPGVLERIPGNIQLKLKITGMGLRWNDLHKQIERHGLEGIVEFLGDKTRDELRNLFARADIYIQPARRESSCWDALEARCAGVPIVAISHEGINGLIRYGQEGFLAQSDQEMEDHLVRLILDSQLRESIARHNREVAPQYNWKKSMIEHDVLYRKAIALRKTFDDAIDSGREGSENN